MRKFAIAKGWEDKELNFPKRATEKSAGYDFEAAETVTVPSFWKSVILNLINKESSLKPIIVPTGIKAYMPADEVLFLFPRSSNAIKKFLTMPNSTGVIDADYVDNTDNDGAIGVPLWNFGVKDLVITKGTRIAQGIFVKFGTTLDDQNHEKSARSGGFGSTDKE